MPSKLSNSTTSAGGSTNNTLKSNKKAKGVKKKEGATAVGGSKKLATKKRNSERNKRLATFIDDSGDNNVVVATTEGQQKAAAAKDPIKNPDRIHDTMSLPMELLSGSQVLISKRTKSENIFKRAHEDVRKRIKQFREQMKQNHVILLESQKAMELLEKAKRKLQSQKLNDVKNAVGLALQSLEEQQKCITMIENKTMKQSDEMAQYREDITKIDQAFREAIAKIAGRPAFIFQHTPTENLAMLGKGDEDDNEDPDKYAMDFVRANMIDENRITIYSEKQLQNKVIF